MSKPKPDPTDDSMESADVEVVSATALERMERISVDTQIATAKQYPREMSVVKREMLSLACLDVETAASCFYKLKRKNADGTEKIIEGPSVRLAEIAANAFGNIRAAARIISNDGKFITAQGVCHDLQRNVYISTEVKRRITNKDGRTYGEDMQVVTGNAACSIALRNSICKVIPMAIIKPVYDAARKAAVGDSKTLIERRTQMLKVFKEMGVDQSRVFHSVGAKGVEDIDLQKLELLIGMHTAITQDSQSIEEMFPSLTVKPPALRQDAPRTFTAGSGQPPVDEPKKVSEDLILLLKNMAEASIEEAAVLEYGRGLGIFDDSLSSLEQVAEMQPDALLVILKSWKSVTKKIKSE